MDDRPTLQVGRRGVLGLAVIGIAAATAGLVDREREVDAAERAEQADKPRYRVTSDVEAFYRVNRY